MRRFEGKHGVDVCWKDGVACGQLFKQSFRGGIDKLCKPVLFFSAITPGAFFRLHYLILETSNRSLYLLLDLP